MKIFQGAFTPALKGRAIINGYSGRKMSTPLCFALKEEVRRFGRSHGQRPFENSPAIYGWAHGPATPLVPAGTKEISTYHGFFRPCRDLENIFGAINPALKGWAIFNEFIILQPTCTRSTHA
jgi:hypothetical protein